MKDVRKSMKLVNKLLLKLLKKNYIYINDEKYLQLANVLIFNKKLDFNNLKTLNEKVQWLKLYDRKKIYNKMVDKYDAKEYVANIIGKEYIIPTIGIYNTFEEIKWDSLPDKFVIKCTHDSGKVIICNGKNEINYKKCKKIIKKSLKTNYYYKWREWPYKDIKPRIIIEKYIGDDILDYKIQCFNGIPDNILVCEGRDTKRGVRYHYFDTNWNYLNYCPYSDIDIDELSSLKPNNLEKMLAIAKKLSAGYPQMRVDLYNISGKIYFGEITFFTNGGFDTTITNEADLIMGSKLKLPLK